MTRPKCKSELIQLTQDNYDALQKEIASITLRR